jgi:cytochrome P450
MTTTTKPDYDPIPLSSLAFWSTTAQEREPSFQELRRERPVSWHPPFEGALVPDLDPDGGYWAVVRHADVVAVSRNPELFCSSQGVMFEDIPEFVAEAAQSFLSMDAPRHTALRRLVSAAFTPRQVARIEEQIVHQAAAIVDDLLAGPPEFDFVAAVSKRLPMWTVSDMMGVPPDDREQVVKAADSLVSWNDPDVQAGREPLQVMTDSLLTLHAHARGLAEGRRTDPADDVMTALVQAEVDGGRLTDDEICAFFVLLSVAGNDTTRNSISHGVKALCERPDQRALLTERFDTLIGSAVEEIVRWATPVMTFRRTATADTELGGRPIAKGDKVVMFYSAANRDEAAFPNADRFDVTRHPNEHVGYGGGGPHFCMGASLARRQLRAIFHELLTRVPNLELGTPELLVGNFIHAATSMPGRIIPSGSAQRHR